jgi:hypothetical protein
VSNAAKYGKKGGVVTTEIAVKVSFPYPYP